MPYDPVLRRLRRGDYAIIVDTRTLINQSADIADTPFNTNVGPNPRFGLFRVTAYMRTDATSGGGTATCTIKWNDGSAQSYTLSVNLNSAAAEAERVDAIYVASGNPTFGVTHTGSYGSYDLLIVVESM